jgi:hypothetical protein
VCSHVWPFARSKWALFLTAEKHQKHGTNAYAEQYHSTSAIGFIPVLPVFFRRKKRKVVRLSRAIGSIGMFLAWRTTFHVGRFEPGAQNADETDQGDWSRLMESDDFAETTSSGDCSGKKVECDA